MTGRRLLSVGLLAVVLTMLISPLSGEARRLSVDLWLVVTTVWLGWLMFTDVHRLAPVRPDRLRGVWRRRSRRPPIDGRPRELVKLEGLLLNAVRSERATGTRLRPRLIDLSDHLLRTAHGIDPARQPERAVERFGEVAWLVDGDREVERPPTREELAEVLSILQTPQSSERESI